MPKRCRSRAYKNLQKFTLGELYLTLSNFGKNWPAKEESKLPEVVTGSFIIIFISIVCEVHVKIRAVERLIFLIALIARLNILSAR